MNQLDYWAVFGINKKMIVGFILLNIVIFGAIGYYGIKIDQQVYNQLPLVHNSITGNTLSSDQGEIFWISTVLGSPQDNISKPSTEQQILFRLSLSGNITQYILFNSTVDTTPRTGQLLQITNGKLYIWISQLNSSDPTAISFLVELTISQLPVGDQKVYDNFEGKIAFLFMGDPARNYIAIEKSGTVTVPDGEPYNRSGVRYFRLSDIDFGPYTFAAESLNTLKHNDVGVQIFHLTERSKVVSLGFNFIDYKVDSQNNIIFRGQNYTASTNLDTYQRLTNEKANYIEMPQSLRNQEFQVVNWFDDGNNFYLIYDKVTRFDFGAITMDNGTTVEGKYGYTHHYEIMAVKGFQNNFSNKTFTNDTGIAYNTFLVSNSTNFRYSGAINIKNGNFYGGFAAYLYNGKRYSADELLQTTKKSNLTEMPSVFLLSASVDDLLTSNISENNYHLIRGGDLAQLSADGWIANGDLNGMTYIYTGEKLSSIAYSVIQYNRDGTKSNITINSSEGIL